MKTIAIIVNKKHSKALKLKAQLQKCLPSEYVVIDKLTEKPGHATILAWEAVFENVSFLIAAGGDGTLNEVINGVMKADEMQRKNIVIGLFPLGTGNDFARSAEIPCTVEQLAKSIVDNKFAKIDLGLASFQDFDGKTQSRYFDNIAEIGVGAKTTEIVNQSNKWLGGTLSFFLSALRAFVGYRKQKVRVKTPDFQWAGKIVEVCIANGAYFGSGLGIAPGAKLNDGKFSLVIVGNMRITHFLKYLSSLRKSRYIKHPEVHYYEVDSCEIFSEEKYPFEMDGDNVGYTPVTAEIVTNAISLLKR